VDDLAVVHPAAVQQAATVGAERHGMLLGSAAHVAQSLRWASLYSPTVAR
jgi:hypothetical protein